MRCRLLECIGTYFIQRDDQHAPHTCRRHTNGCRLMSTCNIFVGVHALCGGLQLAKERFIVASFVWACRPSDTNISADSS